MFNGIFESKKAVHKTSKQTSKVLVDIHEKNSLVPSLLSKLNIDYEFVSLDVADYIINDIAIERKTISDLKSSIINKRILFQLKEIKQYPKHLLIVELNENPYEGIIHENALRGFILSTLLESQVPIIFSQGEEDTAKYILILASKKRKSCISLRKKIPLSIDEQKQFVLEGFPGIGPATTKKLLKQFGSIRNIINSDEISLKSILGKKFEAFKRIID